MTKRFVSFALLLSLSSTPSTESHSRDVARWNYGATFTYIQSTAIGHSEWKHVFQFPLPTFDFVQPPSVCSSTSLPFYCAMLEPLQQMLISSHKLAYDRFNTLLTSIKLLLPDTNDYVITNSPRQTRSVIPGIGRLSRFLFGTATLDDIQSIRQNLHDFQSSLGTIAKTLVHDENFMQSYVTLFDKRMNNTMQVLRKTMHLFHNLQTTQTESSAVLKAAIRFFPLAVQSILESEFVATDLTEILLSIESLIHHKLSSMLLPPPLLNATFQDIALQLKKNYPHFTIFRTDANFYYMHGKYFVLRHGNDIYLTLKIPLTINSNELLLFNVKSYPVPMANTTHVTKLFNFPTIFAITTNLAFYSEAISPVNAYDEHALEYTLKDNVLLSVNSTTCTLALYLDDATFIHKLCDFKILTNFTTSFLLPINRNNLLVFNMSVISLTCQTRQSFQMIGCFYCIIKYPCLCSIQTNSAYFPERIQTCERNFTLAITKYYPVNLALLNHFFGHTDLLTGSTLLKIPLNITLPELKFYHNNLTSQFSEDTQLSLSLRHLADAAKINKLIYKSITDKIIDGDIDTSFIRWTNSIGTFVITGIVVLNCLSCALIVLYLRVRKLHATVAILALQSKHVAADLPTAFVYTLPPATNDMHTVLTTLVVVLSCLLLILFIWTIYRMYCRYSYSSSVLTLELSTSTTCISIDLLHLPSCPGDYSFEAQSYISRISISGFFNPILSLTWPDLVITRLSCRNDRYILPQAISISILAGLKIRSMIAMPYSAHLFILHAKHMHQIQIDGLNSQDIGHQISQPITQISANIISTP